jgi:hypothetical protein
MAKNLKHTATIYNFDDYRRAQILRAAATLEAHNKLAEQALRDFEQAKLNFFTPRDRWIPNGWQHSYFGGSDCGCANGQSRWFQ